MSRRLFYIITIFIISWNHLCSASSKDNYSSSSLLSSGQWFKIAVVEDGVYKIDYSDLVALGIDNPANPRIFGNNNGQLSFYNDGNNADDLKEIAVFMNTGSDHIFNAGDYLLFYGEGTNRWIFDYDTRTYDYVSHFYSDTAYYFLTSETGTGKRIVEENVPPFTTNYTSSSSDMLFIHEEDEVNLLHSGREWFQQISSNSAININPKISHIINDEPIKYHIRVAGRSSNKVNFEFTQGTDIVTRIATENVNMSNYNGTYAQIADSSGTVIATSASPVFSLSLSSGANVKGWLDFVELQGRIKNIYDGGTIFYKDSKTVGQDKRTLFSIETTSITPTIWDVTNSFSPVIVRQSIANNNITFYASTDSLKIFVAFNPTDVLKPKIIKKAIANQDLHASESADMIIISHPLFEQYAQKLANLHYANSGLKSLIVTPEEVYNEFSGGIPDITALRNFIRMKYLQQLETNHPLRYLLLFGDGSYDNKTLPPDNPNFIPTFQSQNSNMVVSSFTSDDFYTLLEDGEGEVYGTEDIGVGRLPVTDTTEAGIIVRKIAKYMLPTNRGDWKNMVCLVADDEDSNTHIFDAENLALTIESRKPQYNIKKIYLDAYRQSTAVSGQSYPEASAAINEQINSGCLIFNYVGHGNENGLAAERVLKIDDIATWTNEEKLPLFITATCEFSRFDDVTINAINQMRVEKKSAGEKILLSEHGGGIALMSTTRIAYSSSNHVLNKNIYDYAFETDDKGNPIRLGDIMRLAKRNGGDDLNKRNFSLLGDPALRLAYPYQGFIITDSINGVSITQPTDTLKALSEITISGHIENIVGQLQANFNGTVTPVVYDKPSIVSTLANDGGSKVDFKVMENIIYKGNTSAVNGRFKFTFIVPRDINYTFGQGKIRYYAFDNKLDMNGSFASLVTGGFAEELKPDTKGPIIRLFINDTLFKSGGITNPKSTLLVYLEDPAGINNSGHGIGHDITLRIDDDEAINLNNYFINNQESYTEGTILYPLTNLQEGEHGIIVKAWDNYNNSSQTSLTLRVLDTEEFILDNISAYPNPATEQVKFTAEHNHAGSLMKIVIKIYDLSGKVINIIQTDAYSDGNQLPEVIWDCKNSNNKRVTRGLYPFSIEIQNDSGQHAIGTGRVIILQE